jgi:hypothetical protein
MFRRLLVVAVICGTAAIGFTAAEAVSATGQTGQSSVQVGFKIGKFVKRGHNLVALGTVTTKVTTPDGQTQTVSKPYNARVTSSGFRGLSAATRTCAVLNLTLNELDLTLLGLNVHLGKVVLSITANSREGVLGSLFCSLAHSKIKLASLSSTARRLTTAVHKSGLSTSNKLVGFRVPMSVQKQSATGAVCPILDLVLGPLHLDLLGLIVDLNQVHLTVTADPTGGVLGSLFCSLANTTTTLPVTT